MGGTPSDWLQLSHLLGKSSQSATSGGRRSSAPLLTQKLLWVPCGREGGASDPILTRGEGEERSRKSQSTQGSSAAFFTSSEQMGHSSPLHSCNTRSGEGHQGVNSPGASLPIRPERGRRGTSGSAGGAALHGGSGRGGVRSRNDVWLGMGRCRAEGSQLIAGLGLGRCGSVGAQNELKGWGLGRSSKHYIIRQH